MDGDGLVADNSLVAAVWNKTSSIRRKAPEKTFQD